jgi:hypothetical protein
VDIGAVMIDIGLNAPSGGREHELAENHRQTLRNVGGTSHGESPSRHRSVSDGCPVRDAQNPILTSPTRQVGPGGAISRR